MNLGVVARRGGLVTLVVAPEPLAERLAARA